MLLAVHASVNNAPEIPEGICQQHQNSQASEACVLWLESQRQIIFVSQKYLKDEVQKRHVQV